MNAKIALPTNDGINISGHFGRTKGFRIIRIENSNTVKDELKNNTFTGHAKGQHNQNDGHQSHSHDGILSALGGCDTVIANGMGRRLYTDLKNANLTVFITKEKQIARAVDLFLKGELDNNEEACCNHNH